MKQQPDQLFHEKLADHAEPAPERAWSRIERKLSPASTESSFLWLKIAAAIVLLLCAFIFIWQANDKPTPAITQNALPEATTNESAPIAENPISPGKNNTTQEQTDKNKKQARTKKKEPGITNFSKQEQQIVEVMEDQPILATSEALQENELKTATAATIETVQPVEVSEEETTSKPKSSIIHYTAAEVNEKYILPAKDNATSADESASTFRKLLDKAADIKTNHSALAELRQRKNEILALNLDKKDKSEKQNN